MDKNICIFMPDNHNLSSVHIINFVLETKPQPFSQLKSLAMYKMHLVTSGTGNLHVTGSVIPVKAGDIFFTFPDMPFCIEPEENFKYMYK